MRKSIETAVKVAATAAVVTTLAAETAVAHVVSPSQGIERIARKIEAQRTRPGPTNATAEWGKKLPHHQVADVTIVSAESAAGLPDPTTLESVKIGVYSLKNRSVSDSAAHPIRAITFALGSDGKWCGYSQATLPGGSLIEIGEFDEAFPYQASGPMSQYCDGSANELSSFSPASADRVLNSLIEGGGVFVQQIVDGQPVLNN